MTPNQAPPHDPRVERDLLTTLCAPGADADAAEWLPALTPEDFLVPQHRAVYRAAAALQAAGQELSLAALADQLRSHGDLGRVGDWSGLTEILSGLDVARPGALVAILQRDRKRRDLIRLGTQLVRDAFAQDTPDALAEALGASLARLAVGGQGNHLKQCSEALERILGRLEGHAGTGGAPTGMPRVDAVLGGLCPGRLYVLAARPGIGKTALALNWALAACATGPVLIFSMEMPDEEIMTRLVANTASVPVGVLTSGTASDYQRGLVHRAVADLRKKQLLINDRAAINASQIVSQVDRAIQQAGELPALVVVDYLQLISQPDAKRREDQALGDITRALKICAKDKNVPVLLLSQLNREVEGRSSTAPRLADLRGSGCIEQDADCVLFLHRQNKPDAGEVDNTAELLIAKHRAGPLGQIPMAFHGQYQRYEVVTRETSYTGQQAPRQGRQL